MVWSGRCIFSLIYNRRGNSIEANRKKVFFFSQHVKTCYFVFDIELIATYCVQQAFGQARWWFLNLRSWVWLPGKVIPFPQLSGSWKGHTHEQLPCEHSCPSCPAGRGGLLGRKGWKKRKNISGWCLLSLLNQYWNKRRKSQRKKNINE